MMAREKQLGFGGGKPPAAQGSWLAGVMIGMTVSNLATAAMIVGTSSAIGRALAGKTMPNRRTPPRWF
jgi:hypothetical protein